MKQITKNKYQPFFTMEEILAFNPSDPQTHTNSPFMNKILTAMCTVKPVNTKNIAYHLGVDPIKFTHTMEVLTGYPFHEIHRQWNLKELARIEKQYPYLTPDEIAQEMGLSDRSAIWNMKHPEVQRKRMRNRRHTSTFYR